MAYPKLDHANHVGLTHERVGDEVRLTVTPQDGKMPTGGTVGQVIKKQSATEYDADWEAEAAAILEAVAGGAGFVPVSGAVELDLASARAFHHELVGHLSSLSFTNVPNSDAFSANWTWVLRVNATGGYTVSGTPAVTFVDGSTWSDLNLSANAVNVIQFGRKGSITYAAFLANGALALDPHTMTFPVDGTVLIPIARQETLVLGSVMHRSITGGAGSGSLEFRRNDTPVTGTQVFAAGQVLAVTRSGGSAASGVSIPRRAS